MHRLLPICLIAAIGCTSEAYDPMEDQPKVLPYRASAFFPDQRAMRPPPDDTVARGRFLGSAEIREGITDGAYARHVPLPIDERLLAIGQKSFDIVCAACHGLLGDGQSKVAEKMSLRLPPSLLADYIRNLPDGALFKVITEGYGFMPSYADRLTLEERWAVVAYMRALQLSQAVPAPALPDPDRARLPGGSP